MARIYEKQSTPAPVLPFVFYHGKKEWRLGTSFQDYLKLKPEDYERLGRYLPNFTFELFDVTLADVGRLEITLYTSTFLQIMQAASDENTIEDRLEVIFYRAVEFLKEEKLLEKLRKLFLFVYALSGLTKEQVSEKLSKISQRLGDEAMTTAQKLHEEGLKQGREEGLEEGLEKGLEQGLERGREEEHRVLAKRLLDRQVELDIIIETSGLSQEEIEKLK